MYTLTCSVCQPELMSVASAYFIQTKLQLYAFDHNHIVKNRMFVKKKNAMYTKNDGCCAYNSSYARCSSRFYGAVTNFNSLTFSIWSHKKHQQRNNCVCSFSYARLTGVWLNRWVSLRKWIKKILKLDLSGLFGCFAVWMFSDVDVSRRGTLRRGGLSTPQTT